MNNKRLGIQQVFEKLCTYIFQLTEDDITNSNFHGKYSSSAV